MKRYQVLLVDDEKPARETLRCLIDWQETAFQVAGTARDGREALALFKSCRPDLIITDIQMPVMDGLELIRAVRQESAATQFVILSCHEKFAYARAAMQLGVSDYLIKDLLTPADLYSALAKAETALSGAASGGGAGQIRTAPETDEYSQAARNAALKAIVFEEMAASEKSSLAAQFALDLQGEYFLLLVVQVDDYQRINRERTYGDCKALQQQVAGTIRQSLGSGLGGECCHLQDGEFIAIARLREMASQMKYVAAAYGLAEGIRRGIGEAAGISVTIGISRSFRGFGQIMEHYREAAAVIQYKILLGKGRILFYNSTCVPHKSISPEMIEDRISRIRSAAQGSQVDELNRELRQLFRQDLPSFMEYHYLQEVNSRLFAILLQLSASYHLTCRDIFGCGYLPLDQVEKLETASEIGEWFCQAFARLICEKEGMARRDYSLHIQSALAYIHQHYPQSIGLAQIAAALNLHKVYLCRLFKQETGENLAHYILHFRIGEAKRRLLTTDRSLAEIAGEVGFASMGHFSTAFRKSTGLAPAEFRRLRPDL